MSRPKTTIGDAITVEGTITSSDDIVVHGRVHGKVETSSEITVAKTGRVEADLSAASVEIAGALSGGIAATGRAEIKPDGRMVGDIKAPRILIADGARFTGHIDMG